MMMMMMMIFIMMFLLAGHADIDDDDDDDDDDVSCVSVVSNKVTLPYLHRLTHSEYKGNCPARGNIYLYEENDFSLDMYIFDDITAFSC